MNRLKIISLGLVLLIVNISCQNEVPNYEEGREAVFVNNPYPTNVESLRILAIGNSFTDDATSYMYTIADKGGIDPERYCLYTIAHPAASINHFLEVYKNKSQVKANVYGGHIIMNSVGTLADIVAQDWDVIVIQQSSDIAGQWQSYSNLGNYIRFLVQTCTNDNLCIVLQMPWSHTREEMPYALDQNIKCTKKVIEEFGIDVIIPTGTAIQLARNTELNDNMYLTDDNWHLNKGIGRYIANCLWFQKLFVPAFGGDIIGNSAIPTTGTYTESEIRLAQKCAKQASIAPWDYNAKIE